MGDGEPAVAHVTTVAFRRAVIPAQAGIHIPETVAMGPRLRGDDSGVC